jgi:hypothetical protein
MALFNMTNKSGVSGIIAFKVSSTGYDCTVDPITTDYTLTLYHNGVGSLPTLGDLIYTNSVGTILWTSSNEPNDRNIQTDSSHLKVNSEGASITTC